MKQLTTVIAIAAAGIALTACGGEPKPPKHGGPAGPHAGIAMPPASPAIHFQVTDADGNTLNLQIECGADTALKECAEVNQSIIDRVAKIRANSGKK